MELSDCAKWNIFWLSMGIVATVGLLLAWTVPDMRGYRA